VLAVRSIVFVLRRDVQLVEPEVCGSFNGRILCHECTGSIEYWFEQYGCLATDNPACASRYAWTCVLHHLRASGAVLGRDLLPGTREDL
jgi:hypothetical protein